MSQIFCLDPCPFLPDVDVAWSANELRKCRGDDDYVIYNTALCCAQSRWREALPAQALLMINRAFSLQMLDESGMLEMQPWPYAAVGWIVSNSPTGVFLGNPRRHFQHLATRMNQSPMRELRIARAWACWAIVRKVRPDFPADEKQIETEGVCEPGLPDIEKDLLKWADAEEVLVWKNVLDSCCTPHVLSIANG